MTRTENTTLRVSRERIRRFVAPESIAVIGASESSPRHAVRALLDSALQVYLVNPSHRRLFGRDAYPDLQAIGRPVDAVLTLVNARAAIAAVEQAAAIGAAGVAVNAAGFAEAGPAGAALQQDLVVAAGNIAVLGPNCNGFVNATTGAFLAGAPKLPLRAGSIGMVTHSGGFITDAAVAAVNRQIGFTAMISTGNEAVTDMVDYLEYFVDDPLTRAICLIIERITRPRAFFRAVERARQVGKPIVALKLGRSARGREVARSHTGAIVGESWIYDSAFRQYGIIPANDLGDLLDRVMLFDQLPTAKWSSVSNLAVISVSGGAAALASDVAEQEGLPLPDLRSVAPDVTSILPAATVMNPLDMTGFVMNKPDDIRFIFDSYARSPDVDAVMTMWTLGLESRGFAEFLVLPFAEVAARTVKPMVLSMTADGAVSPWAAELMGSGAAVAPSLRSGLRALASMAFFERAAARSARLPYEQVSVRQLVANDIAATPDGAILTFAAAMNLLESYGIQVAPYVVIGPDDTPSAKQFDFDGPFVVKLADCAHRTEIGAVRIGVGLGGLDQVVGELRTLSAQHGLPPGVVVQPLIASDGEAFVGADASGELGSVVLCGLGGIHVEALGQVDGRLVPVSEDDALDLVNSLDRLGVFTGSRGAEPWDRHALAGVVRSVSAIASSTRDWLQSLDINPLMRTSAGFVAVDAVVFVAQPRAARSRNETSEWAAGK